MLISKKKTVMSAIDLGSYSLKMKIVEVGEEGSVRILENLSKPASLGKDVFSLGKVKYETVDEICDILTGFKMLMQEYGSKKTQAVATSAIREASNKDQLIDLINLKTGIKVEVLNNGREKFLTYKALRNYLPDYEKMYYEGIMLVEVGSGNVEVTLYQKGHLIFTHSIKLGHLRLRKVLSSLEKRSMNFPILLEEYVNSHTDRLERIKESYSIPHFMALGSEMKTINKLCNKTDRAEELTEVPLKKFNKFYVEIFNKPTPLLIEDYGLSADLAGSLLPSMIILKKFAGMTRAKKVITPYLSLNDGLVADFINKRFKTQHHEEFEIDILKQARALALKYETDLDHADNVEKNALILFDALKQTHGLKSTDRLLLQLAAMMHDCGKYVNLDYHHEMSCELVKGSGLFGLSNREISIVAAVTKYHSAQSPYSIDDNLVFLSGKDRVISSKLIALIRLADALDTSHSQKLKNIRIGLKEKELFVRAESETDTTLEEWVFDNNSFFFQEVFGLYPKIKVKRKIDCHDQGSIAGSKISAAAIHEAPGHKS